MAKYEEHNKLDFRQGGDTLHQFAEKYMNEITRVFAYLNEIRGNEAGSIEPTANQLKIESNKIYVRDSDNVEWVLLGESKPNFGFKDADETFISTKELPAGKVDDINNIDFSKIVTKDDLTQTGEAGKIPYINDDGLLPISVDGNAALIGGIRTEFNNLSDGQVLTFRSESNTWRNEPKGAIGSGKALAIYQGDTLLAQYDGSQSTSVDITGLADKHIVEHNAANDSHADIRAAIPTKLSELKNDTGFISYAPTSTLIVEGSGNGLGDISCDADGRFTVKKKDFLAAHQDISGKADKTNITAGQIGSSANSTGTSLSVPYINVNSQGVITGYGTKQHNVTGFITAQSPALTGTPTTPTAPAGSNNYIIANTAFVQNAVNNAVASKFGYNTVDITRSVNAKDTDGNGALLTQPFTNFKEIVVIAIENQYTSDYDAGTYGWVDPTCVNSFNVVALNYALSSGLEVVVRGDTVRILPYSKGTTATKLLCTRNSYKNSGEPKTGILKVYGVL